jgi:hypothetical protein
MILDIDYELGDLVEKGLLAGIYHQGKEELPG